MINSDFIGLWLHILGLIVYAGTTTALITMALPVAQANENWNLRRKTLANALKIYDPLAIAALGVLIISGAFSLTKYKEALRGEFFAKMGWLLVIKLSLAFVLVVVGTYITFGIGHRIVSAEMTDQPIDKEWLRSMEKRLLYSSILCLILIAATSFMGLALGHPS